MSPRRMASLAVATLIAMSLLPSAPAAVGAFKFGVAARAESTKAMLWTRAPGTGVLRWRVAKTRAFDRIVAQGRVTPTRANDLTVKPVVRGLQPDTTYFYYFETGDKPSQTGKFHTLPAAGQPASLKLALSGDSDALWTDHPDGNATPFEVLRRVAEENPDLFLYFGDTIYSDSETGAPHALTVQEKWAKYKGNRLAATRKVLKTVSTWAGWDDHEVINDFDGAVLATEDPDLLAAGIRAFNDYWPIKEDSYYRKVDIGSEIDLIFLDERSFRTQSADETTSPCRDAEGDLDLAPTMPQSARGQIGLGPVDPACLAHVLDPTRTMLGAEQLAWLKTALSESDARWKLIVNEVPMTQIFVLPYDRWDGYAAERTDILSHIRDNSIENVVFLTTDIHANVGSRVYVDIDQDEDPVAYEVVAGPIQTCTLECEVDNLRGPGQGQILKNFLITRGLIDADCVQINQYGYATIEIPRSAATLKATWRSNERAANGGGKLVTDCSPVTLAS